MCCKHCKAKVSSDSVYVSALRLPPYGMAQRLGRHGSGNLTNKTENVKIFLMVFLSFDRHHFISRTAFRDFISSIKQSSLGLSAPWPHEWGHPWPHEWGHPWPHKWGHPWPHKWGHPWPTYAGANTLAPAFDAASTR